jgi:hypothetical protein|tara:strand:+ start:764 stop:1774 length:1011 start_codon:yes stop_codon:yes gene_type:complete
MASQDYSFEPKTFKIGLKVEDNTGTESANVAQVFADSVVMPSMSPQQDLSPKASFFVSTDDLAHSTSKGQPVELTFSGLYNDTIGALWQGILHAASADGGNISMSDSYTPPDLVIGASVADTTHTFTVKVIQPSTTDGSSAVNNTITLVGCTITNLTVSGDSTSDGGRLKYSCTVKTGFAPIFNDAEGTTVAVDATGICTMFDFLKPQTIIAGVTSPVLQSFSLSVSNPSEYIGWDPSSNKPYAISRSVPEVEATLSATVKFDKLQTSIASNYFNASAQVSLANELSNHDTDSSWTNFGFSCDKAIITSLALNEQAAMMYDIEQKLLFGTLKVSTT